MYEVYCRLISFKGSKAIRNVLPRHTVPAFLATEPVQSSRVAACKAQEAQTTCNLTTQPAVTRRWVNKYETGRIVLETSTIQRCLQRCINACFLLYQIIVPCKHDLSSLRRLRCNNMQCCVCLPQNQCLASAIDAMPSCIESRCPKGHTRHWAHEKGSCKDGLMADFGSWWANEH